MESQTYLKNLRVTPKKIRFLLSEVKKMKPQLALDYLLYMKQDGARVFYQALKSAITNAKNSLKVTEDVLQFKLLTIEEGSRFKRFRPGGRGTAKPIKRRLSHMKIILEAPGVEKVQKVVKVEKVLKDTKDTKVTKVKKVEKKKTK